MVERNILKNKKKAAEETKKVKEEKMRQMKSNVQKEMFKITVGELAGNT